MHVITHTCPDCGTVVAANELERHRVMKCPGLSCESVLEFEGLPADDRDFFLDNRERYQL